MISQFKQLILQLVVWGGLSGCTLAGYGLNVGEPFTTNISMFGTWVVACFFIFCGVMGDSRTTVTLAVRPWALFRAIGYVLHLSLIVWHIGFGNWWTSAFLIVGTIFFWSFKRKYEEDEKPVEAKEDFGLKSFDRI